MAAGHQDQLEAMCRDWPFFSTRLGMLEVWLTAAISCAVNSLICSKFIRLFSYDSLSLPW
jgi:phosphoenolpyruvate carboxylase